MIPQVCNAFRIVFLCICLFSFTFSVSAQVIYVKSDGIGDGSSWANATAELKTVLDNASAGSEIWVAAGTYTPTTCTACSETDRSMSFEIPDGVALYGGFIGNETEMGERDWVSNPTILSGDINGDNLPDSNAFTIIYTENVTLATIVDGFTIRDGMADQSAGFSSTSRARSGAAWFNLANINSSPSIQNCRFENNYATDFGAGIFNNARAGGISNPSIRNCVFINNEVTQSGAGIFNDASLGLGECSPTIVDCSFENNMAKFGAGVYNSGFRGTASPRIIACRFINNTASSYGGACYNFGKETGQTRTFFANCVFVNNQGSSAGAIYSLGDGGTAKPQIVNCTFYGNHANTGGAVYCNESDGGDTEVTISNCIFWENTATFNPTFHMSGNSTPRMNISYSLFDASDCSTLVFLDPLDSLNCGDGLVFNQDPLFEDVENFNFHLQSGSPAKDLGDNTPVNLNTIYFDMDSLIRVHNEVVDFGAYEKDALEYIPPSIITQPVAQTVCEGEPLLFSVSTEGTGTIYYQWQKDGANISGATEATYTIPAAELADMASYRCKVVSFTTDVVFSEAAEVQVNTSLTVSNAIDASSTSVCAGDPITFTANPTNGGTNPDYQWQVNGENVATNAPTFTSTTFEDSDQITCTLTSSLDCVLANTITSNAITVDIATPLELGINIETTTLGNCPGDPITFTANPMNSGATPTYQWQVNGENVGMNAANFTTNSLSNSDQITCILSSTSPCLVSNTVQSNAIEVVIGEQFDASISIETMTMTSCASDLVTFTATPINGGTTPTYQWQINGENVASNTAEFTTSDLMNNDEVTCILSSSLECVNTTSVLSNSIEIEILPVLDAVVTINSVNPVDCAGSTVTFAASSTNGGSTPSYQWQINGENVGLDDPEFTTNTLMNNDEVTCILSSSLACVSMSSVVSNSIEVEMMPVLEPAITISSTNAMNCLGAMVTFTAEPTNGGSTPSYQWQINGENVGSNTPEFTTSNLMDNDEVTCILSSSLECTSASTVASNSIEVELLAVLDAAITINSSSIMNCIGAAVTFTAEPTNGGSTPTYQWQINGENVGSDMPEFTTNDLNDNDEVTCVLTSSSECISAATVVSNSIEVEMMATLEANIDIVTGGMTSCEGTMVTFTAQATNGGSVPTFQWQINGENVGANSAIFATDNLQNNDEVTCFLTSSASCVSVNTVSSNTIEVEVTDQVEVDITIEASTLSSCAAELITFTAIPVNGGMTPTYQWQVNGENVGPNSPSFSSETLNDNDLINCIITSSLPCTSTNVANSGDLMVNIEPNLLVDVSIFSSSLNACEGETISFLAEAVNPGNDPVYQWLVNGNLTGATGADWTTSDLQNGDEVTCMLTSSALCTQNNEPISNDLIVEIAPVLEMELTLEASTTTACIGDLVTFTANPQNAGNDPVFDWRIDGQSTGETMAVFSTDALANGAVVDCIVQSSATCLVAHTATATPIEMTIETCATSISGLEKTVDFKLFPNPAQSQFNLSIQNLIGPITLTIFDVSGKKRQTETLILNGQQQVKTVECNDLQPGVYIVMLFDGVNNFVKRIVIKP